MVGLCLTFQQSVFVGGSATEQNGVQDLKISLGSQDFYGISIYGFRDFYGIYGISMDLRISMGFQFMDFEISMGLFPYLTVFYGNNRNKYIAWDFGSWIQARFQLGFQHLRPRFQLVADPSVFVVPQSFTVEHAFTCPHGGYPSLRHNEIRDITAQLMSEVCPNVATEPILQPVTNERFFHRSANTESGARLDVRAQGFWGLHHQQAYFDVRVFNPLAASNRQSSISACFKSHDREKRRTYEQRFREVE